MATPKQSTLLADILKLCVTTGPGKNLPPQDELSRRFDVSRTSMREALVILEFLNVIKIKPKTGTVVNRPVEWLIFDNEFAKARDNARRLWTPDEMEVL